MPVNIKLCIDCKHSIISDSRSKTEILECSYGNIKSPIDGNLFPCEKVRLIGVVGYKENGEMTGMTGCAPIGSWWEQKIVNIKS